MGKRAGGAEKGERSRTIWYDYGMERRYDNGFRSLITWQEAKKLTLKVYNITRKFPTEELFGLVSQLRRSSSSVMASIAEGSAMQTKAHRDSFYMRARGSAVEVDCHLDLSFALGYLTEAEEIDFQDHCVGVPFLLTKLIAAK